MSKVVTPFLTLLAIICLDFWNGFLRFSFQTKCVFCLIRSRNGCIIGLLDMPMLLGWLAPEPRPFIGHIFGSGSWIARSTGAVEYTDCFSAEEVRPPPYECPAYDNKRSDGEAPVMLELWGIRSTPSLPLLPDPFWPGVVTPDRS